LGVEFLKEGQECLASGRLRSSLLKSLYSLPVVTLNFSSHVESRAALVDQGQGFLSCSEIMTSRR
jgi:hypothetical protein